MRYLKKRLFFLLILASVYFLYFNLSKIFSKTKKNQKIKASNYKELDYQIEIPYNRNLSYSDIVAYEYMRVSGAVKECDIMNETYFVFIEDHSVYDKLTNSLNYTLIKSMRENGLFKNPSSNTSDSFYSLKLNIKELVRRTKLNELDFSCEARSYDKKFKVSEAFGLNYNKPFLFTEKNDYTLYFEKHGYYYVYCHKESNSTIKIYEDSFLVLPKNMSKLVDERKEFQKREIQGNNLTYEADNGDKYLKFLDSDNKLLIEKKMNVLILGFDSLSYQHFQRIMPKTFNFLTKSLEKNVMFTSMNRVGENTHPNIWALLSGIFISKIDSINVTSEYSQYLSIDDKYLDKLPFIWHKYENGGFFTSLHQDATKLSVFNYLKKGFRYKPTSFYSRPFWMQKYLSKSKDTNKCYHGRPYYRSAFSNIKFLLKRMHEDLNRNLPFFFYNFFTEYTHDNFVFPHESSFDLKFKEMVENFDKLGFLNDTLLVIFSDHGARMIPFSYQTEAGMTEENLPFVSIRLPKILWNSQYQTNLLENKNKLVTAFDIYQTLRHFYHLNGNYSKELDRNQFKLNDKNVRQLRGISLFEEIPINRSCRDAFIPETFCSLKKRIFLTENQFKNETGYSFNKLADYILEIVNGRTKKIREKCELFKFKEIERVTKFTSRKPGYNIFISLNPGYALFQVVVTLTQNVEKPFSAYSKVVRMNPDKNESNCVESSLKPFCYCKN